MRLIFDDRWCGQHGIGRFASEISRRFGSFRSVAPIVKPTSPFDPVFLTIYLLFLKHDVYFSPGYNAPFFSRKPFVFTVHDLNHVDVQDNSSLLKRLYYKIFLRRACRGAMFICTVSEYSKNRISEWAGVPPEKIIVLGNGVSSIFSPEGDQYPIGSPYFLCVSNRKGHKNEIGVLKAFCASAVSRDVKLVFTGDSDEKIQSIICGLGLSDRVVFTGKLTENELAALYRGAICLLFPSFYEGFGLPALEAMASGTPVITSNCTSLPEVVGDSAILVSPLSIDEIAKSINCIYESLELRKKLSISGIARSKIFNWDSVFSKLVSALISKGA